MRAEFGLVLVDEGREDPNTSNTPFHQGLFWSRGYPIPILWLIGRMPAKTIGNNQELADNHLGRSGAMASVLRTVGYRKSDRLLFLNLFKNSSRSKPVGQRSLWSFEGPLKVSLSRLPSGAFLYHLELSSTRPVGALVYPLQLSTENRA